MPQDGDLDLVFRVLLADALGVVHRSAVLLGHEHDTAVLALADAAADEGGQLVDVGLVLRDDGGLGAGGDGAVLRQEARVAPHHLHEEDAVVAVGGVADLVHALHDGVEGGVVADGGVRPVEVVVDGAGQADDRDVVLAGEGLGPGQGAVPSDHHQGVDAEFLDVLEGLGAPLRGAELVAAGGLEDGTAALDGVADAGAGELLDVAHDQTLPAAVDAEHAPAFVDGGAGDGADGGIHPRCIST